MKKEKEKNEVQKGAFCRRKRWIAAALVIVGLAAACGFGWMQFFGGEKAVSFEEVSEKQMPQEISSDVIPEYKTLERALACVVDEEVYVIVTRGEKPTSGFGVVIDRMALEEQDGKTNLIVYALFEDPRKETAISQIITYPLSVVKTDLSELPDTIELRIQY